jgi:hypothetical protein
MRRIGGRRRRCPCGGAGADGEIPPFYGLGSNRYLLGQRLVGSLTGAVASESVTEAPKGPLGADGNRAFECKGSKGA